MPTLPQIGWQILEGGGVHMSPYGYEELGGAGMS